MGKIKPYLVENTENEFYHNQAHGLMGILLFGVQYCVNVVSINNLEPQEH